MTMKPEGLPFKYRMPARQRAASFKGNVASTDIVGRHVVRLGVTTSLAISCPSRQQARTIIPGDRLIMRRVLFATAFVWLLPSMPLSARAQGTDKGGQSVHVGPEDWPWWRGPNRDGVADPRQTPP